MRVGCELGRDELWLRPNPLFFPLFLTLSRGADLKGVDDPNDGDEGEMEGEEQEEESDDIFAEARVCPAPFLSFLRPLSFPLALIFPFLSSPLLFTTTATFALTPHVFVCL